MLCLGEGAGREVEQGRRCSMGKWETGRETGETSGDVEGDRYKDRESCRERVRSMPDRSCTYTVLSPETVLLVVKGTGSRDRFQKYLDKNG